MRQRFFLIILSVLITSTVAVLYVQSSFFANERLRLVDKQIRQAALTLINSELGEMHSPRLEEASRIISQELGPERIGMFFVMRDNRGGILYQSASMSLLKMNIPRSPQWVTLTAEDRMIRVLNLDLPSMQNRTLQVGLILDDPHYLTRKHFSGSMMIYILGIAGLIFFISAGLTIILLSPFRRLNLHLREATGRLKNLRPVPQLPTSLLRYGENSKFRADELAELVVLVQILLERINSTSQITKAWSFQMAHELKTPLALIQAEIDSALRKNQIGEATSKFLISEVTRVSTIISHFMDWADAETRENQENLLHAVPLPEVLNQAQSRLERAFPNRLHLSIEDNSPVLANPSHVDQLIDNLLTNSLKYSPHDSKVEVKLRERKLSVRDFGQGIPNTVMQRLGQPFNVGPRDKSGDKSADTKGTGLGLAWTKTLARLYSWDLKIDTSTKGTEVIVTFPPLEGPN